MVYEEKFITKYNIPPLKVVGWEGIFGFCTLVVLLIPMYFIKVPPGWGKSLKEKNCLSCCVHIV